MLGPPKCTYIFQFWQGVLPHDYNAFVLHAQNTRPMRFSVKIVRHGSNALIKQGLHLNAFQTHCVHADVLERWVTLTFFPIRYPFKGENF